MLNKAKIYSSFSVPNLEEAKEFYGKILGLNINERPEGLDLQLGDNHKVFIYFSANNKPADFTVLNFVVDDVPMEVDELLEKSIVMEKYNIPGLTTDEKGVARDGSHVMAWFKDPVGNIIALSQRSKK